MRRRSHSAAILERLWLNCCGHTSPRTASSSVRLPFQRSMDHEEKNKTAVPCRKTLMVALQMPPCHTRSARRNKCPLSPLSAVYLRAIPSALISEALPAPSSSYLTSRCPASKARPHCPLYFVLTSRCRCSPRSCARPSIELRYSYSILASEVFSSRCSS